MERLPHILAADCAVLMLLHNEILWTPTTQRVVPLTLLLRAKVGRKQFPLSFFLWRFLDYVWGIKIIYDLFTLSNKFFSFFR